MNANNTLKMHIGYWINRLRSRVHQSFEERIAAYGISVAAWCIMVTIYDRKASSIHELAHYIEVDKASISRVVEKLVAKKLLLHKVGKDRRSGHIELTPEGKTLVPLLVAEAERNEEQFFGHLTAHEKVYLHQIMQKIIAHIPDMTLDGWLGDKN